MAQLNVIHWMEEINFLQSRLGSGYARRGFIRLATGPVVMGGESCTRGCEFKSLADNNESLCRSIV